MIVQAWNSSTWWAEAEDRELEARWVLVRLKKKKRERERGKEGSSSIFP